MSDQDLPLQAKVDELHDALRKVGLYEDSHRWLMPEGDAEAEAEMPEFMKAAKHPILTMSLLVGDLAFAPRVQAPDQDAIDREFAGLERRFSDSEFDETQERMRRRIAEGKDPFAEED